MKVSSKLKHQNDKKERGTIMLSIESNENGTW
jgi:hypothetical protein